VSRFSIEEIWNHFKNIVYEGIEQFVPHKKKLEKIRIPSITTKRSNDDNQRSGRDPLIEN
jgi:hypothetical protein